ncbi:MAG: hypothetical protein K2J82_02405 [Muribaculaceae bacterium]|nr:hypothetical protein [Muribaculaceae bacterium]MDE6753443.1 hypothetical protein [Muribaculaceae bacterium]
MKKFFLSLSAIFLSVSAFADFTGAGFYRLKNQNSQRYVSVIDNDCAYVDLVSGSIDSHALITIKSFDEVCHDPSTIIYAAQVAGSKYNIAAQGVSIKNMVQYDLHLGARGKEGDQTIYWLYASKSGATKYLCDPRVASSATGYVSLGNPIANNVSSQKKISWFILPVTANSSNYFGVLPTVEVNNGYWASLYAFFPFSAFSEGVEFYYPCAVSATGLVEMKKVEGTVPGEMPVIVKCNDKDPARNRLNVGASNPGSYKGNLLHGQYFNCYANDGQYVNRLPYHKETMRVLGKCKDGSLGFVVDETLDFIPANSAYIIVEPWYPKELKCVFSHDEYIVGVKDVKVGTATKKKNEVYSLTGVKLYDDATEQQIANLPAGMYIIGGKKKVVRK